MEQPMRMMMNGKKVVIDLPDGSITRNSIRNEYCLSETTRVSLTYNVDGEDRSCRLNESGTMFLLPNQWPNIEFTVKSDETTVVPPSLDRPCSPYSPAVPTDPAPSFEAFKKFLFFIEESSGKSSTTCVHRRFLVTFHHGTHSRFKIGDTLTVHRVDDKKENQCKINVRVASINENLDFILLRSDEDLVDRGPTIAAAKDSEPYTLAGYGNENGCISFLPGMIHATSPFFYFTESKCNGPFLLGSSRSSRGDSGGSIWGARGLLGINAGCTMMPSQPHHMAISEAATFSPKSIITASSYFEVEYSKILAAEQDDPSPPPKRTRMVLN